MINVQWCSLCSSKPSIGEATIDDGYGNLMDIGLCEDCYEKIAPPGMQYSIPW